MLYKNEGFLSNLPILINWVLQLNVYEHQKNLDYDATVNNSK